jgi:HEPN domain-containing protein
LSRWARHYAARCFHSQQAGEKAVKAYLYALGLESRGHSITCLLRVLKGVVNISFKDLVEDAKLLDKHSPQPHELYTRRDANKDYFIFLSQRSVCLQLQPLHFLF